jgi:hypothetical protein
MSLDNLAGMFSVDLIGHQTMATLHHLKNLSYLLPERLNDFTYGNIIVFLISYWEKTQRIGNRLAGGKYSHG